MHGHAQGTLAPAVSLNNQRMTHAVKPNSVITSVEQQQAAQSAVTAARQQQMVAVWSLTPLYAIVVAHQNLLLHVHNLV